MPNKINHIQYKYKDTYKCLYLLDKQELSKAKPWGKQQRPSGRTDARTVPFAMGIDCQVLTKLRIRNIFGGLSWPAQLTATGTATLALTLAT